MIFRVILLLSLLSLINCQTQKPANEPKKETPSQNDSLQINLKQGENKFLQEFEMNVTFKKITEDSRCPKDVHCIWAGNATAEIEVMGIYTRPVVLKLSTTNDYSKKYSNTQKFNGYLFTLLSVSPENTTSKGFKELQGIYQISLQIEKEKTAD